MSRRATKIGLAFAAGLLLSIGAEFVNLDSIIWPGAVIAAGIFILMRRSILGDTTTLFSVLMVVGNALVYSLLILVAAWTYQFFKRRFS